MRGTTSRSEQKREVIPMATATFNPKKKESGQTTAKRWVYRFNETDVVQATLGGSWDKVRSLLGGKGAGLGDMTRAGIPVPAGFTVTTEACNQYMAEGVGFMDKLWGQVLDALKETEAET